MWLGTGFLYACTYCPKCDRTSQATSICLLTKFQAKKELVMTASFAPFDLRTMQHLHLRHFHSAEVTTEGKRHYLAELPLSTFAKRTVPLNRAAWSYNNLNTSKNKHRHRAAALGRCCKEGHGEVRAKLPGRARHSHLRWQLTYWNCHL